jgi:hypothetical protein
MNGNVISAVFDNRSAAERAIQELRSAGVSDNTISVIGKDEDSGKTTTTDGAGEKTTDFISKTAAGAGVGALLGVAALAIPGVGPLVAAGAIAESAIGGAALTGTAVGATAGGLTSVLTKHGVSDEDAGYYEDRINEGHIFVSVRPDDGSVDRQRLQDILRNAGGHNAQSASAGSSAY